MNGPGKESEVPARRIAVTGAFGYSGRYIAQRLLAAGHDVFTLTNSPARSNPFGEKLRALPFHFDQPARLEESLRGTHALINTYWVRFDHKLFTHQQAVANTRVLFDAAKRAGAPNRACEHHQPGRKFRAALF